MAEMKICDCECECECESKMKEKMSVCEKCKCECECEKMMKARMREKITKCARKGEIEGLYSAIREYPTLLQDIDKIQFVNTPLHEAAGAGRTSFAIEIMNLMPSFGKKLNPEGLSPVHVAIERGHYETAQALVKIDKQLACIKGKEGLTPLHYAARKPNIQDQCHSDSESESHAGSDEHLKLLAGLLLKCPDSIGVLNNRLQNAIHVALESENFRAAHILVNWLILRAREPDLAHKDDQGNTVLHIAAQRVCAKNKDVLELIMSKVKVNKQNNAAKTPLDIARADIKELLKHAGGRKGKEFRCKPTTAEYLLGRHSNKWIETFTRAYYFLIKDMTMEMRNAILVVAALIATATYQGVLQPPGGVFSAEGNDNTTVAVAGSRIPRLYHLRRLNGHGLLPPPGRMVMVRSNYSYFMPTNTFAFILSTVIIIFVLPGRSFTIILQFCLIFMCLSYILALNFISGYNGFSYVMLFLASSAIFMAFLLKIAYYVMRAVYDQDVPLLHGIGVRLANLSDRRCPPITRLCSPSSKDEKPEMSVLSRMRKQFKLIRKS